MVAGSKVIKEFKVMWTRDDYDDDFFSAAFCEGCYDRALTINTLTRQKLHAEKVAEDNQEIIDVMVETNLQLQAEVGEVEEVVDGLRASLSLAEVELSKVMEELRIERMLTARLVEELRKG